jgi:replication-associated recombination protein RarA
MSPPDRSGPPPTFRGYLFAEVASAMQKSIRRRDEEGALFWSVELDRSGYGEYVWRRLRLICSEDVGLAEPLLPAVIRSLYENWTDARKKRDDKQESWRLFLIHAVLLLSRARKSRVVDHALIHFYNDNTVRPIPDIARDKHTVAGRQLGRSRSHFFDEASLLADPETGELSEAPTLPDRYRDRARKAIGG